MNAIWEKWTRWMSPEGNLDSDDFRTVLSRRELEKQRVNKDDADTVERGPSKDGVSGAVLDSIDHNTLCRHTVQNVPTEQFVWAMDSLQRTFLETMAEAAKERGLQLADKVTLMLQGQTGYCSDLPWGQDRKDVLELYVHPGKEPLPEFCFYWSCDQ